jgi:hypothetical protein
VLRCTNRNRVSNSKLVLEEPRALRSRLQACVAAAASLGYPVGYIVDVLGRNVGVAMREPHYLASQLHMLHGFFHPHGDKPVTKSSSSGLATLTSLRRALLPKPDLLSTTDRGLAAQMQQLIRFGLVETDGQARAASMRDPRLLRKVSWFKLVESRAAVEFCGGTPEDVVRIAFSGRAVKHILEEYLGPKRQNERMWQAAKAHIDAEAERLAPIAVGVRQRALWFLHSS